MRYADILTHDTANGPGLRVTIFTQGCPIHCKECHNPELWSFEDGKPYSQEVEDKIVELIKSPYIRGLSILGGEPLIPQNLLHLYKLVVRVKALGKDVWLWTGYNWNELVQSENPDMLNLLRQLDVLVDGQFLIDCASQDILFRGSTNQRLIDVQETIAQEQLVLYDVKLNINPKC